eukprot:TRINITY_DN2878_c0_g1_i3.p1 TRINITY_DN2878_c0_g1~~TRINITY_DN2878_c0_g1_i3.p1  ORF type:complete len:154 (-),score=30.95 TRINITY_DN2878_c0_g1_i3:591-995(-)
MLILCGNRNVGKSTQVNLALRERDFVFHVNFGIQTESKKHFPLFPFLIKKDYMEVEIGQCLSRLVKVLEEQHHKMKNPVVVFDHCETISNFRVLKRAAYGLSRHATVILIVNDSDVMNLKKCLLILIDINNSLQ